MINRKEEREEKGNMNRKKKIGAWNEGRKVCRKCRGKGNV